MKTHVVVLKWLSVVVLKGLSVVVLKWLSGVVLKWLSVVKEINKVTLNNKCVYIYTVLVKLSLATWCRIIDINIM